MTTRTIKAWYLVHKWTSLVCTAFLLMLCITGLPLIFHGEIDDAFGEEQALAELPAGTPHLTYDQIVARALAMHPAERPLFMSFDDDRPVVNVTTGPEARSGADAMHITAFDLRTGEAVGDLNEGGVMHVILTLHIDMFAGLPGKLFLGFMGLLFVVSLVSGVVVYAPFMRRLRFGTVRVSRSKRVKWLDLHNMLGIVTLAWLFVVGLTGVINTLSEPLVDTWRRTELADMTSAYQGLDPVPVERFGSLQGAVDRARAEAPGMEPQFVAFPGVRFTSEHHYAVWMRGGEAATKRIYRPALIDAQTGDLTAMREMPWYMLALRLSQPLHFGDYGGLPLKILWALLDIVAIIVLSSGLYLWLGKRRKPIEARLRELGAGGEPAGEPRPAPAE